MPEPQSSVLLPVYNGSRYLRHAIESVLAQTDERFELIICDDASRDDSADIASSYRDARVTVLRNPTNQGLFPTLNRLAAAATSPRLRFWAQDDVMLPHCLATEHAFLRDEADVVMTYCQYERIGAGGQIVREIPYDDTPARIAPWHAAQIAFYWGSIAGNISTAGVNRSLFQAIGGYGTFRVAGDFDLWVRIAEHGVVGFINRPLVQVRDHTAQFSQSFPEWLTFIREERAIYERLLASLPLELRSHARLYHRCRRGFRPLNYAGRCLLHGNLRAAADALREFAANGDRAATLLLWLATVNGRLWQPQPRYVTPPSS
jgi:glycosyltransferase involved in cell wall biosynthesis